MTTPVTTCPRGRSGGRAMPAVLAVAALSALAWTCAVVYVLADRTTG
ncbi:morphogenic membrane protein MmpA [Streptomyces sp. NPDC055051]